MASKSSQKRQKRWKWRLEWLAQVVLEEWVARLPAAVTFRLGEWAGALAWHFLGYRRRLVLRNLRIALLGEYDLPTIEKLACEAFRRTGGNLLSAVRTARIDAEAVKESVSIANPEEAPNVLQVGKGAVVMPPHMGNWEILSKINRILDRHEMGAFYRPLNNPLLNQRVLRQRSAEGTRMFSKRDGFHKVSGFLRDGGIVGILADQRVGKQGEVVRFFGRLTRASPLPGLMARRSKCGIFAISLVTASPGKWRVGIHPVAEPVTTGSCMAALENAMRASPLDVFWFQERWKVYVNSRYTIRDWLGDELPVEADAGGPRKPHRALVWMTGTDLPWTLPAAWMHPDVEYEVVVGRDQTPPDWHEPRQPLHRVPGEAGVASIRRALEEIDRSHPLPVDFILAPDASRELDQAARAEAIRLVSLPSA